jgi:hypothetical protein
MKKENVDHWDESTCASKRIYRYIYMTHQTGGFMIEWSWFVCLSESSKTIDSKKQKEHKTHITV